MEALSRPIRFALCHPEKRNYGNGKCASCYSREYYATHPEKRRQPSKEYTKQWQLKNKDRQQVSARKYKYGVTEGEFNDKLLKQKGLCAICKERSAVAQDHNHVNGQNRGILCKSCNIMLGFAKDAIPILESAIVYLKFWNYLDNSTTDTL